MAKKRGRPHPSTPYFPSPNFLCSFLRRKCLGMMSSSSQREERRERVINLVGGKFLRLVLQMSTRDGGRGENECTRRGDSFLISHGAAAHATSPNNLPGLLLSTLPHDEASIKPKSVVCALSLGEGERMFVSTPPPPFNQQTLPIATCDNRVF